MKPKMTSCTLNILPPLTEAQEANLKALAARPESDIDYTDIPALTEEHRPFGGGLLGPAGVLIELPAR